MFLQIKKYKRNGADGNIKVWRLPGTRYDENNTIPTIKFCGGEGVMVWAAITYSGKIFIRFPSERLNSEKYVEVLNSALPQIKKEFENEEFIFQQDGAPYHTSFFTKNFFVKNNILVLEWAVQSPDMNIIENLWALTKRKMGFYKVNSTKELINKIKTAVSQITKEEIRCL